MLRRAQQYRRARAAHGQAIDPSAWRESSQTSPSTLWRDCRAVAPPVPLHRGVFRVLVLLVFAAEVFVLVVAFVVSRSRRPTRSARILSVRKARLANRIFVPVQTKAAGSVQNPPFATARYAASCRRSATIAGWRKSS